MRIERAEPEEVGLDRDRLAAAEDSLAQGLAAGEYPGAAYVVGRRGKVAACGALGRLGSESEPAAALDSVFDVASLTKPVATASSLMLLVERGVLHLDRPVTDFLADTSLPHLSGVTVKHLAVHTSGLPASRDMYSQAQSREEAVEQLLHTPLESPPGANYTYSCLGYIMLGLVIERAAGMSLADFAPENIFEPLGMLDTCFNPPKERADRIARTSNCPHRQRVLIGEVHDPSAFAMGGVSGNAGLFSTAPDLAAFAQMMLNGGEFAGVRVLDPRSAAWMLSNQLDPARAEGQAYGFFVRPNERMAWADAFSDRAAGHTGFTGTSLLIDPEYDMFVVLLTNRAYYDRDASDFLDRRRLFHNIVASAVR